MSTSSAMFPPFPLKRIYYCIARRDAPPHQSKPKGRLKAHDGYSFFIKFYLATLVLLGVMATLFLIGGTTFAKDCDMQVRFLQRSLLVLQYSLVFAVTSSPGAQQMIDEDILVVLLVVGAKKRHALLRLSLFSLLLP